MKVRSCTKYDFYGVGTVPFQDRPDERSVAFKWMQVHAGHDPIMDGRWSLYRGEDGWKIGAFGFGPFVVASPAAVHVPKNWEVV